MRNHVSIVDYFIICSVKSERQCRAAAGYVMDELGKAGIKPRSIEGEATGAWIVVDYDDIVVHLFLDTMRSYYDLDGLWSDARRAVIE